MKVVDGDRNTGRETTMKCSSCGVKVTLADDAGGPDEGALCQPCGRAREWAWEIEYHGALSRRHERARQVALADADFLALRAAYLALPDGGGNRAYWGEGEFRTLLGFMRDRRRALGVEGAAADELIDAAWLSPPANEIPW